MQLSNVISTSPRESTLPTFSLVFETENLSSVELDNIYRSLNSLVTQDISLEQANEFLIIDSGDAPPELIAEICSNYPWIQVHPAPHIGYYAAKMLGASLATGDIVIYCDSDCVYTPNWLRDLLVSFNQYPDINMVAGETTTPIRSIYELAIALHYFFPRLSNQSDTYISDSYFLNNVAFRRAFLLSNPIPTSLPLYRGNCNIHHHFLQRFHQEKIIKRPQAQALHEPPTVGFITWRYLLKGRDSVIRECIKASLTQDSKITNLSTSFTLSPFERVCGILSSILSIKPLNLPQVRSVLREDKTRILLFPLALPIVLLFEMVFILGKVATYLNFNLILNLYYTFSGESENKETVTHEDVSQFS
ncbi:glycosyltransferase family A protein [Phormidesmis sp. 146-35]